MRKETQTLGCVLLAALITQSGCAYVAHKDVDVHGRGVQKFHLDYHQRSSIIASIRISV